MHPDKDKLYGKGTGKIKKIWTETITTFFERELWRIRTYYLVVWKFPHHSRIQAEPINLFWFFPEPFKGNFLVGREVKLNRWVWLFFFFFLVWTITEVHECESSGSWVSLAAKHLNSLCARMCAHSLNWCLTLRSMDCNPPSFSVYGILQARILEWVTMSSSREFSQPKDLLWLLHCRWILHHWATGEAWTLSIPVVNVTLNESWWETEPSSH